MQRTLETFFAGKLLRVPPYQRDYAWELHHVNELWGDIREAISLAAPHYVGTFILAQTPTAGSSIWSTANSGSPRSRCCSAR